jgi:acyl carrier protein
MGESDGYVRPLREFVVGRFLEGQGEDLRSDSPLLELGILDSFSIMEIVAFSEERFGIRIPETELTPANLSSLTALARLIARHDARGDIAARGDSGQDGG